MIENQNKILDNQEDKGLPLSSDTNQRVKNIESILINSTIPAESR